MWRPECETEDIGVHRKAALTHSMVQAFDESSSFLGAIKTLESFEGLLDRPALAAVVRKCGAMLMSDLSLDLRRVR